MSGTIGESTWELLDRGKVACLSGRPPLPADARGDIQMPLNTQPVKARADVASMFTPSTRCLEAAKNEKGALPGNKQTETGYYPLRDKAVASILPGMIVMTLRDDHVPEIGRSAAYNPPASLLTDLAVRATYNGLSVEEAAACKVVGVAHTDFIAEKYQPGGKSDISLTVNTSAVEKVLNTSTNTDFYHGDLIGYRPPAVLRTQKGIIRSVFDHGDTTMPPDTFLPEMYKIEPTSPAIDLNDILYRCPWVVSGLTLPDDMAPETNGNAWKLNPALVGKGKDALPKTITSLPWSDIVKKHYGQLHTLQKSEKRISANLEQLGKLADPDNNTSPHAAPEKIYSLFKSILQSTSNYNNELSTTSGFKALILLHACEVLLSRYVMTSEKGKKAGLAAMLLVPDLINFFLHKLAMDNTRKGPDGSCDLISKFKHYYTRLFVEGDPYHWAGLQSEYVDGKAPHDASSSPPSPKLSAAPSTGDSKDAKHVKGGGSVAGVDDWTPPKEDEKQNRLYLLLCEARYTRLVFQQLCAKNTFDVMQGSVVCVARQNSSPGQWMDAHFL